VHSFYSIHCSPVSAPALFNARCIASLYIVRTVPLTLCLLLCTDPQNRPHINSLFLLLLASLNPAVPLYRFRRGSASSV
jgi:hypothetical protein